MAPRVTALGLAGCTALVAMLALVGSASACDGKRAKVANASASSCATKSKAVTATATPAAKPAARAKAPIAALPRAEAPVVTSAFPALPAFGQPAPVVAGLMAYIDPETGLIGGPIGELIVPDDVARAMAAPVDFTPVTMPDGSVMVDLQGSLQDYYVLTIDPLGRRSIRCVQDPRRANVPVAPVVHPIAER